MDGAGGTDEQRCTGYTDTSREAKAPTETTRDGRGRARLADGPLVVVKVRWQHQLSVGPRLEVSQQRDEIDPHPLPDGTLSGAHSSATATWGGRGGIGGRRGCVGAEEGREGGSLYPGRVDKRKKKASETRPRRSSGAAPSPGRPRDRRTSRRRRGCRCRRRPSRPANGSSRPGPSLYHRALLLFLLDGPGPCLGLRGLSPPRPLPRPRPTTRRQRQRRGRGGQAQAAGGQHEAAERVGPKTNEPGACAH